MFQINGNLDLSKYPFQELDAMKRTTKGWQGCSQSSSSAVGCTIVSTFATLIYINIIISTFIINITLIIDHPQLSS